MRIKYSRSFLKQYTKLSPKLRTQTDKRILLWQKNPQDLLLHDHALRGKYRGYRSINIAGDLRAIYSQRGNTLVIFGFIGTHSQLYG